MSLKYQAIIEGDLYCNMAWSALIGSQESHQADSVQVEDPQDMPKISKPSVGPPTATVTRRAKSYSDFYVAARSQLRREAAEPGKIPLLTTGVAAVKTEVEFREWLGKLEEELLEATHGDYMIYHEQLIASQSHIDTMLENVSETITLLTSITESFESVQEQTSTFQDRSQDVLTEEQHTSRLADDINENLRFYDYLDPISRKLNAPGAGQLVREKEFAETLLNLDRCLKYMEAHPDHNESPTYRSRYRLLLTRALSLLRTQFLTSLREIASEVSKRITDRQLNDTTMSALLYGKFKVAAPELKRLGQEIQKRGAHPEEAGGPGAEYQNMLHELYQGYAATRGKLILPLVRKRIGEISMAPSTAKDLPAFARSSISYVRSICLDEHNLWKECFEGDERVYEFLESVCEPLYDYLRPRIMHETQLTKLCELCTLIQTRYTQDQEETAELNETGQLDFSVLIQPTLEDAQSRLVFRTQAIVQEEIANYRPKREDIDRFIQRHSAATSSNMRSDKASISSRKVSSTPMTPLPKTPIVVDRDDGYFDSGEATWSYDTDSFPDSWYPTLRKAIWLLSRIYRLVNSAVFDDLAHGIVHQTTTSLLQASSQVTSRASTIDGQLFLMKHLLILKSQIVAFDFEYVTPEVTFDFSNLTNTFWELRERGALFNPRNLLRLMGGGLLPRVVENMLDAKAELDGRLRTVINDFTNGFASRITADLTKTGVRKHASHAATEAVQSVRNAVKKEAVFLRKNLDNYLDDVRTKETLVVAIYEQVIQNYELFYEAFDNKRNVHGKAVSASDGGEEDEVWDPDTFADWAGEVFDIGKGQAYEAGEDGDGSRTISRAGSV
ncbi:MAG: Golgi transport complex subunit 3 [Peltula sp. TS41687]|nr:MAG: Golgi transport complex subunit 3 [Peltula sp. TS41687]